MFLVWFRLEGRQSHRRCCRRRSSRRGWLTGGNSTGCAIWHLVTLLLQPVRQQQAVGREQHISCALQGDTFSISALHLAIKVPYFSNSGHKNEKVTALTVRPTLGNPGPSCALGACRGLKGGRGGGRGLAAGYARGGGDGAESVYTAVAASGLWTRRSIHPRIKRPLSAIRTAAPSPVPLTTPAAGLGSCSWHEHAPCRQWCRPPAVLVCGGLAAATQRGVGQHRCRRADSQAHHA
eukprot:SAG31_NODE_8957_length_1357_cov_1.663752_1_plen_236_part_00